MMRLRNPEFVALMQQTAVVLSPFQSIQDSFETYGTGDAGYGEIINAGSNWVGAALIVIPITADDSFETYGTGATDGSNITGGNNWNGAAVIV